MGWLDGLTGGKQRDDYAAGHTAYRNEVRAGASNAKKSLEGGYENALARYRPHSQAGEQGRNDFDLYRKSIGLGGADGYNEAYGVFQSDPFRQHRNQNVSNVLRDSFRRYNAGGMANSGANMLAQGRIGAEFAQRDVDEFRNRLMGAGQYGQQVGFNADAAMAGLDYGHGRDQAGVDTNSANALAHSYLNHAYGDAQTRGIGANNFMRLAGLGVDGLTVANKAKWI